MDAQAYAEMYSQMAGNFAVVVLVVVAIGWLVSQFFSKPSKPPKTTGKNHPSLQPFRKRANRRSRSCLNGKARGWWRSRRQTGRASS